MSTNPLPQFRYHPDPVASRVVVEKDIVCACCGEPRALAYVGPVYGQTDGLEGKLCPWCIADGSAALKFGSSFSDVWALDRAGVPAAVSTEVAKRTPGYITWQSEEWLAHCDDACAFLGDATALDVAQASEDTKAAWRADHGMSEAQWADVTEGYAPGRRRAFYKFGCLHCGVVRLGWDGA